MSIYTTTIVHSILLLYIVYTTRAYGYYERSWSCERVTMERRMLTSMLNLHFSILEFCFMEFIERSFTRANFFKFPSDLMKTRLPQSLAHKTLIICMYSLYTCVYVWNVMRPNSLAVNIIIHSIAIIKLMCKCKIYWFQGMFQSTRCFL